jgi:hypothetical protein
MNKWANYKMQKGMHEKHTYCKEKAPCKLELIKLTKTPGTNDMQGHINNEQSLVEPNSQPIISIKHSEDKNMRCRVI